MRLRGKDWAGLFAAAVDGLRAAYGLTPAAAGAPAAEGGRAKRVVLRAGDPESLLVAWLNELNYTLTCERALPLAVRFEAAGPRGLRASVALAPLGGPGAVLQGEVKAATYSGLRVVRGARGLEATVTLDV